MSAGAPPVTETFRAANLKALAEEVVDRSNYVTVTTGAPARLKAAVPAALPPVKLFKPFIGLTLTKGSAGESGLTAADYVGLDGGSGRRTGIQALEDIDEVAMCAVPGVWNGTVLDGLLMHHRRLARDYETHPHRSEAIIHIAMIDLISRRLTRESTQNWRDT